MENVRRQPEAPSPARLRVLITRDRAHGGEHWTEQLPRLLEPQGVRSYVASTGREAIDLAGQVVFHAAVIDMGTPVALQGVGGAGGQGSPAGEGSGGIPGGLWILELFRRMPNPPAAIVVQNPAYSQRQLVQVLEKALRLGAFSVLNKPVGVEQVLDVFRRLLERQYRGGWPGGPGSSGAPQGGFPGGCHD